MFKPNSNKNYTYKSNFASDEAISYCINTITRMRNAFVSQHVLPMPLNAEQLVAVLWHPDDRAAHNTVCRGAGMTTTSTDEFRFTGRVGNAFGLSNVDLATFMFGGTPLATAPNYVSPPSRGTRTIAAGVRNVVRSAGSGTPVIFPATIALELLPETGRPWGGVCPVANTAQDLLAEWAETVIEHLHAALVVEKFVKLLMVKASNIYEVRAVFPSISLLLQGGGSKDADRLAEKARAFKPVDYMPSVPNREALPAASGWVTQGNLLLEALKANSGAPPVGDHVLHFGRFRD